MPKTKTSYVCTQCGAVQPKWMGKCPDCGSWNTLIEQVEEPVSRFSSAAGGGRSPASVAQASSLEEIDSSEEQRYLTGMGELNRVLGGGIVPGSVVLLSGDPGIGKSTLLLQICQTISSGARILYVSGEESLRQIKLRAARLGVTTQNLALSSTTDIEAVVELIRREKPDIVMVDSIQTMNLSALNSSSGSVTQVRECTQLLINLAKSMEVPVFIVGHVNKDGAIAGPKVLEHMVDAVLYFEGERNLSYRILRAIKNRYGSTNEIGVFEMGDSGLDEVSNPSRPCWKAGRRMSRAPAWPASSRAPGPFWPRCRRWSPRAVTPRRAGWRPASTTTGWRCCWRCWKSGAATFSGRWTPTSMWSAACGWTSPRRTCRWRWRWSPT